MKKRNYLPLVLIALIFASCKTTDINIPSETIIETPEKQEEQKNKTSSITLLFAGDVMAHNVNYNMKDYDSIWDGVRDTVKNCDLAFANIEAPLDTTRPSSSYPAFNMPKAYAQATIDAGFNVFSLCNNHTNDQNLSGILQTIITTNELTQSEAEKGNKIYFAGLRQSKTDKYSHQLIEKNDWKILFLPMTEILNTPIAKGNVNYINSSKTERTAFIEYCKQLREENPCDLFIISLHANETEYIRTVTKYQQEFYDNLFEAGVDIIWANHAHIIKDRKVTINSENGTAKIVMYANGNTISGQRTSPNLTSSNPIGERDNTGDGLFYKVTFTKTTEKPLPVFKESENLFITVFKPQSNQYIIKFLNEDFINYLRENNLTNWVNYLEKRKKINEEYTKEIIEWQ